MIVPADSTLLFIGDSITDCEREWTGGKNNGLGKGYVSMVAAAFDDSWPPVPMRILNRGVSGNEKLLPPVPCRMFEMVSSHRSGVFW